jgi:hypothetical protein
MAGLAASSGLGIRSRGSSAACCAWRRRRLIGLLRSFRQRKNSHTPTPQQATVNHENPTPKNIFVRRSGVFDDGRWSVS